LAASLRIAGRRDGGVAVVAVVVVGAVVVVVDVVVVRRAVDDVVVPAACCSAPELQPATSRSAIAIAARTPRTPGARARTIRAT
jgi:hypothetical protein